MKGLQILLSWVRRTVGARAQLGPAVQEYDPHTVRWQERAGGPGFGTRGGPRAKHYGEPRAPHAAWLRDPHRLQRNGSQDRAAGPQAPAWAFESCRKQLARESAGFCLNTTLHPQNRVASRTLLPLHCTRPHRAIREKGNQMCPPPVGQNEESHPFARDTGNSPPCRQQSGQSHTHTHTEIK